MKNVVITEKPTTKEVAVAKFKDGTGLAHLSILPLLRHGYYLI